MDECRANGTFVKACEEWHRKVYEFNSDRLAEYRKTHPETAAPERDDIPGEECNWNKDEFCVNADCPMCADYCPVAETPGVCKFDSRSSR